jgi:hypothetical protein
MLLPFGVPPELLLVLLMSAVAGVESLVATPVLKKSFLGIITVLFDGGIFNLSVLSG